MKGLKTMMQVSALGIELIRKAEGFCPSAYICPAGLVTIGYGNTTWEDGEPIHLGDEIDEAAAKQLLWSYVRNEVEPAMDRLIKVPLQPCQRDAYAGFLFNFGETKAANYTLTRLINEEAPTAEICDWWVKYRVASGKPLLGLYRRRLAEVLMWNGLPTDKAWNATTSTTWRDLVGVPAYTPIKAEPAPAAPTPKPEPKPMPRTLTLPDEWDTMTAAQQTAWLNTGEFIALGGTVGEPIKAAPLPDAAKAPLTVTKKVIETPKLVDASRPKPMETSQTFKGLSKQDSGRETALIGGGLATVTMAAPAAKELTGFFKAYDMQTILIAGGTFAGILLIIGGWRWWAGRMIAYEGRQKAEQPKV